MKKFSFAIIGSQKGGSTSLHRALARHSSIRFQELAEYSIFENDFDRAIDDIRLTLNSLGDDCIFAIKRPNLVAHTETTKRIYRCFPHLRFLCTVRHPIDRTIAAYFHYMRSGLIPVRPLEIGLSDLIQRQQSDSWCGREEEIIQFSKIGSNLKSLFAAIPQEQFWIRSYRKALTPDGLAQAQRFIGVGIEDIFTPRPDDKTSLEQKVCYSIPAIQISKIVDVNTCLPDDIVAQLRNVFKETWRRIGLEPPALSPELFGRLEDLFARDIELFEELTGQTIPHSNIEKLIEG